MIPRALRSKLSRFIWSVRLFLNLYLNIKVPSIVIQYFASKTPNCTHIKTRHPHQKETDHQEQGKDEASNPAAKPPVKKRIVHTPLNQVPGQIVEAQKASLRTNL